MFSVQKRLFTFCLKNTCLLCFKESHFSWTFSTGGRGAAKPNKNLAGSFPARFSWPDCFWPDFFPARFFWPDVFPARFLLASFCPVRCFPASFFMAGIFPARFSGRNSGQSFSGHFVLARLTLADGRGEAGNWAPWFHPSFWKKKKSRHGSPWELLN